MMNNVSNDDIYKYLIGILRKSTKGNALDPDTFTRYLQQANLEFFNKEWQKLGGSYRITDTFRPLLDSHSGYSASDVMQLPSDYFQILPNTILYNGNKVDLISHTEYASRITDELTQPTSTHPIAFFKDDLVAGSYNIYFSGIGTDALNAVTFMYLKEPDEPFFDYYIDANSEVQYLTEDQSAYTLGSGEVYRDGTAGGSVTSISKELDWRDYDKVKVANIILGYLGVQLEDQASYQHSNIQEQQDDILK